MRLLTEQTGPVYENLQDLWLLAVSKSKAVVYHQLQGSLDRPSGVIIGHEIIQTLEDKENLVGIEIFFKHKVVVACTRRKCAIVRYAGKNS